MADREPEWSTRSARDMSTLHWNQKDTEPLALSSRLLFTLFKLISKSLISFIVFKYCEIGSPQLSDPGQQ